MHIKSHTGASHVSPTYTQYTNTGVHKHKYRNTQYTNTGIHKHKYRNAQKQENTKTKIHSTNTRTIRNAHEVTHRGQPCVTNMYTHNTQSTNTGIQKIKHITCVLASCVQHTYALHVCFCAYLCELHEPSVAYLCTACMLLSILELHVPCAAYLVLSAYFRCVAGRTHQGREGLPGVPIIRRKFTFLDFGEEAQVKERRKTKRRKGSSCQQSVCIGKVTRERCQRPSISFLKIFGET